MTLAEEAAAWWNEQGKDRTDGIIEIYIPLDATTVICHSSVRAWHGNKHHIKDIAESGMPRWYELPPDRDWYPGKVELASTHIQRWLEGIHEANRSV